MNDEPTEREISLLKSLRTHGVIDTATARSVHFITGDGVISLAERGFLALTNNGSQLCWKLTEKGERAVAGEEAVDEDAVAMQRIEAENKVLRRKLERMTAGLRALLNPPPPPL